MTDTTETTETTGATEAIGLIPMLRTQPQFDGGPVTALVHPDEVGNFEAGGWRVGNADPQAADAGDVGGGSDETGGDADKGKATKKGKADTD